MADANNLLKESQYENDEVTKPETGECQIKRPSSSDIDPSPEVVAENDNSTVVIKDEFEQENKNVAAQHAGAVGPGEKMEESIKTANLFCAQIPSKEQSSKRSIETAPTLENAPLVQGEVPFVSTGSTEKITLDSRSKMEPAKNARTNLDAVHQNQVTKRSLLKSETLQSLKTKVEHETKQQNASKVSCPNKVLLTCECIAIRLCCMAMYGGNCSSAFCSLFYQYGCSRHGFSYLGACRLYLEIPQFKGDGAHKGLRHA